MTADPEIAFPPPARLEPLPPRGILAAGALAQLRAQAPERLSLSSAMAGSLVRVEAGQDFFLAGPVLGAPLAVLALEDLGRRGAREIIFLGLAGSLGSWLKPGDLFCPDWGLSTEGCSAHYPAPLEPAKGLRAKLWSVLEGGAAQGPVWSTDAIYRETLSVVERHRHLGAKAVDMECTALWAAAAFRGWSLASLLVISDVLEGSEHVSGFGLASFKAGLQKASAAAWRALFS